MNLEYETWIYDDRQTLVIPDGEAKEVGAFVGELLWALYYEVYEAGAPAIDYEKLAEPRAPGAAAASFHEPRGVVAAGRLQMLRRLTEGALESFEDRYSMGWCLVRIPSLFDERTGSWRGLTFKEAGELLGADRKTVSRWVSQCDEAVAEGLARMDWKL